MAVLSFDPDLSVDYVPQCDRANMDKDDVCIIKLKHVTQKQVDIYRGQISRKAKNTNAEQRGEILRDAQKKQFLDHVVGVVNYAVQIEGGVKQIETAAELYDYGDSELIEEIILAMESRSKLSEGQKKT